MQDWRTAVYVTLDREAADAEIALNALRREREPDAEAEAPQGPPPPATWKARTTDRGVPYMRLSRPARVAVEHDGHRLEFSAVGVLDEQSLVEGLAYRLLTRQWAFDRAAVHATDERDLDNLDQLQAFWNTKGRQWSAAQKRMREVVAELRCSAEAKRHVRRWLSQKSIREAWGATKAPKGIEIETIPSAIKAEDTDRAGMKEFP